MMIKDCNSTRSLGSSFLSFLLIENDNSILFLLFILFFVSHLVEYSTQFIGNLILELIDRHCVGLSLFLCSFKRCVYISRFIIQQ